MENLNHSSSKNLDHTHTINLVENHQYTINLDHSYNKFYHLYAINFIINLAINHKNFISSQIISYKKFTIYPSVIKILQLSQIN